MRKSLESIRAWLEREAPHLAASLQPGLNLAQMQEIMGTKAEKYCIPDEVVKLYAWRNGQSGNVPFFDVLRFQPFEEAVAYANLVEEHSDGEFPLMVFQELNYDAGYRFKCGTKKQKRAPTYRWIHGDELLETTSLTDLLKAVAEAFESGVFHPGDDGELDTDEDLWNAIIVRHHPDRLREVNALLNRRWEELSGEGLRQAFFDLRRMNHIQTASLVRECLEGGAERGVTDFQTFHAVLQVGVEIQDEWSRDYALSLAINRDSPARGHALTLLAWRWRGELSLTSQQVDALIDQIMTSGPRDFANRERAMLLGLAGDRRAIPTLIRLLNQPSLECGGRDTRIAALRALGRLEAVEEKQLYLTIAANDSDPGTRITAVRALLELGFEDSPVEAAAKAWIREMLQMSANLDAGKEPPALQRWIEEVKRG
jgi:hypothetical protein